VIGVGFFSPSKLVLPSPVGKRFPYTHWYYSCCTYQTSITNT